VEKGTASEGNGKMENWKTVRGKITIVLISMVILIFANCLTAAGNGEEISAIRKVYRNERRDNDIEVFYPQIKGLDDVEKEKRINYQIRKDATKLIYGELYEKGRLSCWLDYKIKFFNGEIISVCYEGFWGGITKGKGLNPAILTTTVDIGSGKILVLEDVVTDFDTLCEMLIEDEFEGITLWEGVAGNTVSQNYGYTKQDVEVMTKRMKEGWVSRDVTNFDWYTDGSRFVIVISEWNTNDEFAIDLSEVEDILDREFLEKLGR